MAVMDFFDRGWKQNPRGVAYVMDDRTWSYNEAGALTCQIGHALCATPLPQGAKVAVLSPNDPIAWMCVIGTWRAGMVWVPLNPSSPLAENQQLIDSFDCEALFYHSSMSKMVESLREALPQLTVLVSIDHNDFGDAELADWTREFPTKPPAVPFEMDDVVAIAPTGGTTGLPKGVMNTHRSFGTAFAHLTLAFHYDADWPIVNLAAAPMTHTSGILSMPATARGGTVVVLARPELAKVAAAIEQYKITELFLPPTVIYRFLEYLEDHEHDFGSLRYFVYGSAPMSTEKLKQAIKVFGPVMTGAYGQMESPASISYLRPEEHVGRGSVPTDTRLASCGRPYPLIAVEIQDDEGRQVPVGEAGEICVRGDTLMKGYYKDPEKTAQTIFNGWLHTGDVGHFDEEGYLYITDRKKDMIISGGFNVFPSEVEQVLWAHPEVAECAVIGTPHPDWGEAVTAVVELRLGAPDTSEEELIAWCRERLGSIRAPKAVHIRSELPRSVNGKVMKKDIRAEYWHSAGRRI